jgi:crotonobetainyl-CoA:carnitine CoA-transferase CaiB-like acyl-CoA transferase
MSESPRPFEGVRILDFTQVLAGPFASYQLALLGAQVIKVERREGEDMRRTPLSREWAERNQAPSYQAVNGGKRSLTLDLQKPAAQAIIRKLVGQVDVVMENFRPGVMDRLGLGSKALLEINPKLIFCSVSGFGQTGPFRAEAGYDGRIQATSGIMAMTGHPGAEPIRAGFAVCDTLSGMTAAFAVSSALFQRTHTGRGQVIDVSMLEATLAFLAPQVADWTVAGHKQVPWGNQAISRRATANLFRCGSGHQLLACNTEKQYRCLMTAIGRADALDDPLLADWFLRTENKDHLRAIIEAALSKAEPEAWEATLNAAGAPCARVRRVDEALAHEQVAARPGLMQSVETPWGALQFATTGFRLAHGDARLEHMAPEIGADTAAVLAEAGYDAAEIARFKADEVI